MNKTTKKRPGIFRGIATCMTFSQYTGKHHPSKPTTTHMFRSCAQGSNRCPSAITLLWVVLVVFFIYANDAFGNIPPELEQLRQKFGEGKVMYAQMIHEFRDSYTGETEITGGTIWISKEQYRIQADRQGVLVDGQTSRVYNERQNKLIISEYEPEEDDFAPSRFFSDTEEVFSVSETIRENDTTTIILHPDDPFEIFTEVTIQLDKNLRPLEIVAVDQMENQFRTSFQDAGYVAYSDSFFQLEYPEDAEIIDLRK